MSPSATRRSLLRAGSLATLAGLTGLAGCTAIPGDRVSETTTETFDAPQRVTVEDDNGDVTVEPADGDQVEVEMIRSTVFGRERFELVTLAAVVDDGTLALTVEREGDEDTLPRVAVDLTVRLPAGTALDAATTANGDVEVTDVVGSPTLTSANGDVEARGLDGFPTVRSSNGDVLVRDGPGLVDAATDNGNVEVEIRSFEGDVRCSSANGDIEVEIAPDLDADITARTSNGRVTVSGLPVTEDESSRGRFEGMLNAGGPDLECSTANGDVDIEALETDG